MSYLADAARTFAEALFSDGEQPPPSARIDWLVDDFVDFVERAGPRSRWVLGGGLAAAMWLAPATIGRLPPLSRLSIAERCRALDKLEHSPIGLPVLAPKAILSTIYYEHPDAAKEIGIDFDCLSAPHE